MGNMKPDTIRRDNPRIQGNIGMAAALGYFVAHRYDVALPIGESQPWDLIVQARDVDDPRPERVQVKTTTFRSPYGIYVVQLKTCGGNQTWTGLVRHFDPKAVEWLYVLTDDYDHYLIPSEVIRATTTLSLGRRMERYVVGSGWQELPLDDAVARNAAVN